MIPTDPAVKPTARKKTNSSKSLGKEFTIRLRWVIWPCAPQVYYYWENITNYFFRRGKYKFFFLFSKDFRKVKPKKLFSKSY